MTMVTDDQGDSSKRTLKILIPPADVSTVITTGASKYTFWLDFDFQPTEAILAVIGQSSSGIVRVDANAATVSIFTTRPAVAANKNGNWEAGGTAAVLIDQIIPKYTKMTIDVDDAGTGAIGAQLSLIGYEV